MRFRRIVVDQCSAILRGMFKRYGELTIRDLAGQAIVALLFTLLIGVLIGRPVLDALGIAAFVAVAMTVVSYVSNTRAKARASTRR